MTKLLAIGDLHGKNSWTELVDESYDTIVFLGDYVDSFNKLNVEILSNLEEVIEFKKSNPDNVILLIGNHDLQYFPRFGYPKYGCSGYRPEISYNLNELFSKNEHLFQYAYQTCDDLNNFLFTHAGVSNKWFKKVFQPVIEKDAVIDMDETICLAEQLNSMFRDKNEILFQIGWERGGTEEFGSPIWADRDEFSKRGIPLKGYHQIVGHNPVRNILTHSVDIDTRITFIDCLDTVTKGYTLLL